MSGTGSNPSKPKTTVTASSRSSHKPGSTAQPAEKRPATEMDNSSFGDEITLINKQLEQLSEDAKETKDKVNNMLSKDELKDFITATVTSTVNTLMKELEVKIQKDIDKKVEKALKDKTTELSDRLDSLTLENVQLRESLEKLENKVKANQTLAQKAMQKSNYNEQYSRKNNIKIMGVPETADETVEILMDKICNTLYEKAGLNIDVRCIVAIHRIPGKAGYPKPVLMKMMNNHEKTAIMRKRKEMKLAGFRLVDDVTKLNTELINKVAQHENIDSAWFFNGSVFGKTTEGKRHKFDIYNDIGAIIRKPVETDGAENEAASK